MGKDPSQHSSSLGDGWTCTYDVFLSFRGVDTRMNFTDHLYGALQRRGIYTFIDDEDLRRGEEISPALLKAIEECRMAIVVFSNNYASSTWCLDELVKILECVKGKGRMILPVFYDVDPSQVRHVRGSYGEALAAHLMGSKYSHHKVLKWSEALRQAAADFSGWHFKHGDEYEREFIARIVEDVCRKINLAPSPLRVANHPVGLQSRLQELQSLLVLGSDSDVKMVGIYGVGGIGKTAIAKALFNMIAHQFEGFSFLDAVSENSIKHGLVTLQERLLSGILGPDINMGGDVSRGISILKTTLHRKKVLVVLDDVNHLEQLQMLAGRSEWFGSGSRVILTTRDKHLLDCHGVQGQYKVKELNHQEALELFCWGAFKTNVLVDPNYAALSMLALHYAKGLPLALEVIGSTLFHKTKDEWQSLLGKYEETPARTIQEILRVSYEDLGQAEKTAFLDIACFLKGSRLEYVSYKLQHTRGLCPDPVIRALVDKSLISIERGTLQMHDMIQEMGREIVLQQAPLTYSHSLCPDPVIRALIDKSLISIESGDIWMHDLLQEMGREIDLQQSPLTNSKLDRLWSHVLEENTGLGKMKFIAIKNFKRMRNLRLFTAHKYLKSLHLKGHSLFFPPDVHPGKFVMLNLQYEYLSHMNFKNCKVLRELPDLSGVPNITDLRLDHCKNLVELPHSIRYLHKLRCLSIEGFPKLRTMQRVILIVFSNVTHLDFRACSLSDQFLLVSIGCFPNLKHLDLRANNITVLPARIAECSHLRDLYLDDCKQLREIKGIPPRIELFSATNCTSLTSISSTILLCQALHKAGNTQFILPGARIPEWFDHCDWGASVSFWVRKKFPDIALCFVLGIFDMRRRKPKLKLRMLINDTYRFDYSYDYYLTVVTDHILLFDLRSLITNDKLDGMLLEYEWNHVQVSCVDEPTMKGNTIQKEIIISSGVYAYKSQGSMGDIRFTNPHFDKRKENIFFHCDDFGINYHPLLKKQRKFPEMGALETPNMHQQNTLGSTTENIKRSCEGAFEDRDKYSMEHCDTGVKWDIEWLSLLSGRQPLEGVNVISSPVVSKTTSDMCSEKDAKLNEFRKICNRIQLSKSRQTSMNLGKLDAEVLVKTNQTQVEKIHTQVLESRVNLGSVAEVASGRLISMEHHTDHFDISLHDTDAKATYASLDSKTTALSLLIDPETSSEFGNTNMSEETKKALQILRVFVSECFSFLLDPEQSNFMKIILDYLLSLSEDDGISLRIRSVLMQLSKNFALWRRDYNAASVKLELATADMSKVDKLEVDIEDNDKKIKEIDLLENELCSRLASLLHRKRELENQLHAIRQEITELE